MLGIVPCQWDVNNLIKKVKSFFIYAEMTYQYHAFIFTEANTVPIANQIYPGIGVLFLKLYHVNVILALIVSF